MIKYLKNLISTSYSPEYDVNDITEPFLQVRILEILGFLEELHQKKMKNWRHY